MMGRQVLRLLKGLDWEDMLAGEKPTLELISEYMDSGLVEDVLSICIDGVPDGKVLGDFLSMETAFEMVNDFFELNVNLIETASIMLASLIRSRSPVQGSNPPQSTEKIQPPSLKPEDSDSMKESNLPSAKAKPSG